MRALSNVETARLVDTESFETEPFDAGTKHPQRAWIWLGVFAAGAAFWFGVGLALHTLLQ